VRAITVTLAGLDVGHGYLNVALALHRHARFPVSIKEAKVDMLGIPRAYGELRPSRGKRCA
jgi:hypothetical protein